MCYHRTHALPPKQKRSLLFLVGLCNFTLLSSVCGTEPKQKDPNNRWEKIRDLSNYIDCYLTDRAGKCRPKRSVILGAQLETGVKAGGITERARVCSAEDETALQRLKVDKGRDLGQPPSPSLL